MGAPIDRTYDVAAMRDTLRDALTSKEGGPKVIVASSGLALPPDAHVGPGKPGFRMALHRGEQRGEQSGFPPVVVLEEGYVRLRRVPVDVVEGLNRPDPSVGQDQVKPGIAEGFQQAGGWFVLLTGGRCCAPRRPSRQTSVRAGSRPPAEGARDDER